MPQTASARKSFDKFKPLIVHSHGPRRTEVLARGDLHYDARTGQTWQTRTRGLVFDRREDAVAYAEQTIAARIRSWEEQAAKHEAAVRDAPDERRREMAQRLLDHALRALESIRGDTP